MLKAIKRFLLLFLLMLTVSLISGYLTYILTSNVLKKNLPENSPSTAASSSPRTSEVSVPLKEEIPISLDSYIVRLEGSNLSIYAAHNGREEFLYNEPIYINDLSEEDIALLKNGVRLSDSSALTGFLENFTS